MRLDLRGVNLKIGGNAARWIFATSIVDKKVMVDIKMLIITVEGAEDTFQPWHRQSVPPCH